MNNKYNGLRIIILLVLINLLAACNSKKAEQPDPKGLKDIFRESFLIGTALDSNQIWGRDTMAVDIIKKHFSAIVSENCLKAERVLTETGQYDFSLADKYVDFGEKNKMFTMGHTLVWHSQIPDWFFSDAKGVDVSREELIQRMKNHIDTMVGRYKGRIDAWDVVNEAVLEDGSLRQSKYYQIIGPDYIKLAFQFAHEADPEAQLYYNDYSMTIKEKQDGVIALIKELQKDSVPVNGVGMQAHIGLSTPTVEDLEQGIINFSKLGIPVMITELDMTVLPWPGTMVTADVALSHEFKKEYDPYSQSLPDSIRKLLNDKYFRLFNMFKRHSDKISRVTVWGVDDNQSWRNYWPIDSRTDYPLLFDRNYEAKQVVNQLIKNN